MLRNVLFVLPFTIYLSQANFLLPGEIRKIRFRKVPTGYYIFIKKDIDIEINASVNDSLSMKPKLVKKLLTPNAEKLTFSRYDFEKEMRIGWRILKKFLE